MSDVCVTDAQTYAVAGDRPWWFVRIETDAGVAGVGEAPLFERWQARERLDRAAERLVGTDPFDTERLHGPGWPGGNHADVVGTTVAGALDMACWDVKGRHVGVPVHELLGGAVRERLPVYANGWDFEARAVVDAYHDGEPAAAVIEETTETLRSAASAVDEAGYGALKFSPFKWGEPAGRGTATGGDAIDRAEAGVEAVDAAVGDGVDLVSEGPNHVGVEAARRVARRLAPFEPRFFEEPTPADVGCLRRVARASPVPVATGESFHTHRGFPELVFDTDVAVVQPDVGRAGGITELKRIGAMASAANVGLAPHNAAGPVMTAAAVHVDATEPAFAVQESFEEFSHPEWTDDLLDASLTIEDGAVAVPDRSGLGVRFDLDALRARAERPD
jgi:galactonate dehydratase